MKLGVWEGSGNASGPKTKMHLVLWMEARHQEPSLDAFGFILYYASDVSGWFPVKRHTDSFH